MLPQTKPRGLAATDSKSISCKTPPFQTIKDPALNARIGELELFRSAKPTERNYQQEVNHNITGLSCCPVF